MKTNATCEEMEARIQALEREIHALRRHIEELRGNEKRYRSIFEQATDGIFIVDTSGKILSVNESFANMHGFTVEEILHLGLEGIDVEGLGPVPERIGRIMAGETISFEVEHYHKDGHCIPLSVTSNLITIGDERLILAVHRDLSEPRRTEEALERSTQRLMAAQKIARMGDFTWNVKTGEVIWSDALFDLLGYGRSEKIDFARVNAEVHHPGDLERVTRWLNECIASGEAQLTPNEYRIVRKDGDILHVRAVGVIQRRPNGTIIVFATLQDITERKKAEDRIKESEQRWRNILVNTPQVGISLDRQGKIVFVNTHFLELTGWRAEEIVGRDWFDTFVPENIREEIQGIFKAAMQSRDTSGYSKYENEILTRGGELRTVAWSNVLTKNVDGTIADVTCLGIDLTERIRAEEILKASEARYRELFENMPSGVAVYEVKDNGEDFVFKDFNQAGERIDQDQRERLIGRSLLEVRPGIERFGLLDVFRNVWQSGEPARYPLKLYQDDRLTGWYENFVYKLPSGEVVAVFDDVTDRKRAENLLRESEARYRKLADNPLGVVYQFEMTPDGVFKFPYISQTVDNFAGVSHQEIMRDAAVLLSMVHPEDQASFQEGILQSAKNRAPYHTEIRYVRGGETCWAEAYGMPELRPNGSVLWDGILYDVTERKRAEMERENLHTQLLQAQKMESVGRLAGGVAHDFNNKLSVILGNVEMALEDLGDPSHTLHDYLMEIGNAARHSADLTRQLLAFARKQAVAPRVININETVQGMLRMLQRLIGENIDLAWLPGRDIWTVNIDPSQVDQVLANLCVNARDAISGVGKVIIETGNISFNAAYCADHTGFIPGHYVMIAVTDNGAGMSPDVKEHLFEPFFTTKGIGKGTGLGLATVYGIVKQNHGFIHVYSEPGKGTSFKIYLPRHEGEAAGTRVHREGAIRAGQDETVLLVEDEPAILKMAQSMLRKLGYRVLPAATAPEAVTLASEHEGSIDLLITDVIMPEMNGRELASRLQKLHPELKVLFMSGYTANAIAHHGVLDEGINFIQKPFSIRAIGGKIREVLASES